MNDFVLPATRYALSDDVNIAYQTIGEGPIDLVMVPGVVSHIEFAHEFAGHTAFLRRLAKFFRVITFDKRGQGLSDRISGAPSLEQRMDDVRAVMDAVGSSRAALMGFSEGCAMSAMFAASYPERVSHLICFGGFARYADLFAGRDFEHVISERMKVWGTGAFINSAAPSLAGDPEAVAHFAKFERLSTSPGALKALQNVNMQIDVRPILPSVRVPTLVLHRTTDAQISVKLGRDLASRIPGARYIEYPAGDHIYFIGDVEALHGDIEEFITGHRESHEADLERTLATVLFTDIVDSTRSAAEMGDQTWRRLLDSHDQLAKQMVEKHRGILVKSTGDGILATFDGPGRGVRCALALSNASKQIGLPLRAGLHTGEIEIRGRDIGGIAVHAAARVMAQSQSSEVLVSRVVTDLVAGAGLKFTERGSHDLKGLPGRWDLFAANA
ncbi:MAG: adenylate/guanylate cyclase domain-containing protein [Bradyrhizobium sp.]|nr:MAG: adenylate/guanylate cyclase domain-containing protein [Bradyrhizobium sp.]